MADPLAGRAGEGAAGSSALFRRACAADKELDGVSAAIPADAKASAGTVELTRRGKRSGEVNGYAIISSIGNICFPWRIVSMDICFVSM